MGHLDQCEVRLSPRRVIVEHTFGQFVIKVGLHEQVQLIFGLKIDLEGLFGLTRSHLIGRLGLPGIELFQC